jgi:phosphate starvation-inducible PhoH-like protein
MNPYIRPLLDALNQYYSMAEIDVMFERCLEIVPLGFMRGRTFTDSVYNSRRDAEFHSEQMLMLVTRIGRTVRWLLLAMLYRSDIKNVNRLSDFMAKLDEQWHKRKRLKQMVKWRIWCRG